MHVYVYVCKRLQDFFPYMHHFKTNMYPCNISLLYHCDSGCISISCLFCKKIKKKQMNLLLLSFISNACRSVITGTNEVWLLFREQSFFKMKCILEKTKSSVSTLQIKQKHESSCMYCVFLVALLFTRIHQNTYKKKILCSCNTHTHLHWPQKSCHLDLT